MIQRRRRSIDSMQIFHFLLDSIKSFPVNWTSRLFPSYATGQCILYALLSLNLLLKKPWLWTVTIHGHIRAHYMYQTALS